MADLEHKLSGLRELAVRELDDSEIDRTIGLAFDRRRRRRIGRAAGGVVALLVVGLAVARTASHTPSMTFADGSTAELLQPDSTLRVAHSAPDRVEVAMEKGASRFDVVRDPKRRFRVVVGEVVVEVVGTRFSVDRREHEVVVGVDKGRVRVTSPSGERMLGPGDTATFPMTTTPPPPPPTLPSPPAVETPSDPVTPGGTDVTPEVRRWRASAERGNFEAAYRELHAGGQRALRDVPEELMLAADVARWSHHPLDAVAPLERVVRDHRRDPRSQLAAFTLGRVYLEELGRPREAALAFARARELDAKGPLAEDALAHEVEAWSRAGDKAHARVRAEEYLRTFAHGAHVTAVRRFGAIE